MPAHKLSEIEAQIWPPQIRWGGRDSGDLGGLPLNVRRGLNGHSSRVMANIKKWLQHIRWQPNNSSGVLSDQKRSLGTSKIMPVCPWYYWSYCMYIIARPGWCLQALRIWRLSEQGWAVTSATGSKIACRDLRSSQVARWNLFPSGCRLEICFCDKMNNTHNK